MTHDITMQTTEMTVFQADAHTKSRTSRAWHGGAPRGRHSGVASLLFLAGVALSACKDLTKDPGLPAGTPDPVFYNTAEGARGLRAGAILDLNTAIPEYVVISGLLSDELVDRAVGQSVSGTGLVVPDPVDERLLSEGVEQNGGVSGNNSYHYLQNVRGAANIALGALAAYDTVAGDLPTQRVLRGELFALQGYSEILLAELFCSGVPLSTLDFQHDFTYQPGSTAQAVYTAAAAKLDSTMALAAASDSVLNLARVLKGRTLLELGRYAAAADDVALVPTTFQYRVMIQSQSFSKNNGSSQLGTIANREGGNGLPFLSESDARTADTVMCASGGNCPNQPLTMPVKYFRGRTGAGYVPFVVANGIEARLIQAEAALQAAPSSSQWLTILNALRTNGTSNTFTADTIADTLGITGCGPDFSHWCQSDGVSNGYFAVPAGYTLAPSLGFTIQPVGATLASTCFNYSYYTSCYSATGSAEVRVYTRPASVVWNAGTGGVNGLAPLADSGAAVSSVDAPAARVAELFRERAYWLFMTGHRQGDLRRLMRQYGSQFPQKFGSDLRVYPSGAYPAPGNGLYGSDVTVPIPVAEYSNPLYQGCIDRHA